MMGKEKWLFSQIQEGFAVPDEEDGMPPPPDEGYWVLQGPRLLSFWVFEGSRLLSFSRLKAVSWRLKDNKKLLHTFHFNVAAESFIVLIFALKSINLLFIYSHKSLHTGVFSIWYLSNWAWNSMISLSYDALLWISVQNQFLVFVILFFNAI